LSPVEEEVREMTESTEAGKALDLIEQAEQAGLKLRLLGGIAVALHSPSSAEPALQREYSDIDFMVKGRRTDRLDAVMATQGYFPDKRFNGMNGHRRLLYWDSDQSRQIDVFVNDFEMCHSIPIADRLDVDSPTVPLAELFLTKAQIVELNRKDLTDLITLIGDHSVGSGDDDVINADQIAKLCAADWGLWRTITENVQKISGSVGQLDLNLPEIEAQTTERCDQLLAAIDKQKKPMKWKARSKVGDRVQWFELPEDPRRSVETASS
jgi:hypothetical protein